MWNNINGQKSLWFDEINESRLNIFKRLYINFIAVYHLDKVSGKKRKKKFK